MGPKVSPFPEKSPAGNIFYHHTLFTIIQFLPLHIPEYNFYRNTCFFTNMHFWADFSVGQNTVLTCLQCCREYDIDLLTALAAYQYSLPLGVYIDLQNHSPWQPPALSSLLPFKTGITSLQSIVHNVVLYHHLFARLGYVKEVLFLAIAGSITVSLVCRFWPSNWYFVSILCRVWPWWW